MFGHYVAASNARDRDGREFANKVERVIQKLWVSLPHTTLLNTSHSLDILQIMNGYIMSICRMSSYVRRDLRIGCLWWLPNAVKNS